MKDKIIKIAKDLEQGTITEREAENLLLGLFDVSQQRELLFGFMKHEYGDSFDDLFYQIESSIDDYIAKL